MLLMMSKRDCPTYIYIYISIYLVHYLKLNLPNWQPDGSVVQELELKEKDGTSVEHPLFPELSKLNFPTFQ